MHAGKILHKLPPISVHVSRKSNGTYFAKAYCRTEAERDLLLGSQDTLQQIFQLTGGNGIYTALGANRNNNSESPLNTCSHVDNSLAEIRFAFDFDFENSELHYPWTEVRKARTQTNTKFNTHSACIEIPTSKGEKPKNSVTCVHAQANLTHGDNMHVALIDRDKIPAKNVCHAATTNARNYNFEKTQDGRDNTDYNQHTHKIPVNNKNLDSRHTYDGKKH
jgi:hypothetical protein